MAHRKLLLVLLFALLVSGCYLPSAFKPKPAPAPPDEPGRLHVGVVDADGTSQLGFSFIAPDEPDWTNTRKKLDVTLYKAGKRDGENQQIEAIIINMDVPFQPVDRFITQIKKNVEETYVDNHDFKLHAFDVQPYAGNAQCVKSHILRQDTRGSTDPGGIKKWHEQYALSCGSAKYKRFGYEIRYQQWYFSGNRDTQLEEKAEQVFASLRIEEQ